MLRRFFCVFLAVVFANFCIYSSYIQAAVPVIVLVIIWHGVRIAGKWALKRIIPLFTPVTNTAVRVGAIAATDTQAITVSSLIEAQLTGLGIAYLMTPDKDSGSVSASAVEGPKTPLIVHLNDKTPQRENPDSEKWNDAKDGEIDPTPKNVDSSNSYDVSDGPRVYWDSAYDFINIYSQAQRTFVRVYFLPKSYVISPYISSSAPLRSEFLSRSTNDLHGLNASSVGGMVSEYSNDMTKRYDWVVEKYPYPSTPPGGYDYPVLNSDGSFYAIYPRGVTTGSYDDSFPSSSFSDSYTLTALDYFYSYGFKIVNVEFYRSSSTAAPVYYVHLQREVRLCSDGYVFDAALKACVPSSVLIKPPTTPCEIVNVGGSWQADSKNPNCEVFKDRYAISGSVVRIKSGDGETEVIRNADGSYSTLHQSLFDGKWYSVNSSPFNSNASSGGVGSAVNSSGNSSSGQFVSSNMDYGGSAGVGCGGVNNPCGVDDSGFNGADANAMGKFDGLGNSLDEAEKGLNDLMNNNKDNNWGFDFSDFLPPLWPDNLECRNFDVSLSFNNAGLQRLLGAATTVDFCDKAESIRDFMSWVVYVIGVVYIWRRVMGAPEGE